ncbi:uncharacterized protein LOC134191735 [Corticium candelabrum]|uniref:uncharacterized protein LOC134191735 n=1 Tax=Corticium candelabrum TaxID=121492 RepID=UPI002E262AC9|nr:uncharacterized protein LOC134191735 [Corticium candelabrum]
MVLILSSLMIICIANVVASDTTTYFVSPTGNNDNNGSKQFPWQTLSRAIQGIKQLKQSHDGKLPNPVNVMLQSGTYYGDSHMQLNFGEDVSGTADAPITFQSVNRDQKATISGGTMVGAWKETSEGVWTADLPHTNEQKPFYQLWINGTRRKLAHTPVMQYQRIGDKQHGRRTYESYYSKLRKDAAPEETGYIVFQPGQVKSNYHDIQGIQAVVYHSWTASIHQVKAIYNENNTLYLQNPTTSRFSGEASGNRFYLQNVYEMLEPGTFYLDRNTMKLTYHALAGEDPTKVEVIMPTTVQILAATGSASNDSYVDYINWKDVNFAFSSMETENCFAGTCDGQSADFLRTAAINLVGARYWTFDGVTVAHTGGYGLWANKGSSNVVIQNCHFYDLGAGGVRVGQGLHGVIADPTQQTTNVTVTNSVLEDGGHVYQMGCGILLQESAMNVLSHNLIHDFNYTGISIGWTWGYAPTSAHSNYVGFNEIYNIGKAVLSDMGCVYSLGIQPGTVVENNVCHHVWSYDYGGWGYYTDEGSSNITIQNNVVYNTKCAGIHQHYGENNMFVNNIIAFPHQVGCVPGKSCVTVAIRSSQHAPGSGGGGPFSSFTFERNIVYITNGSLFLSTIPTGFDNMTFDNNIYWSMKDHTNLTFPPSQHPTTFRQWQAKGKDTHSMVADPQFVNAMGFDFMHLQQTSPALKLGFKPIDTSHVGPQTEKGRRLMRGKTI